MSIPTSTRAIVLQNYAASGAEVDLSSSPSGTFAVKEIPLPSPLSGDSLLVQTLYLSNDAGVRILLQSSLNIEREDIHAVPLGTPFPAIITLSRVVQVGGGEDAKFKVGDIVITGSMWAEYAVVPKGKAQVTIAVPGISITASIGSLGLSGATAYWALKGVLKPKETDTLVVSCAAGAVGNVAVQFAKKVLGIKRVVAIAGTDEKCDWLKSIGADEAVNYKSATFAEDLAKATPDKVDSFFDVASGSVLDEVLLRMKPHGIICEVGAMALFGKLGEPVAFKNYLQLIVNRLSLVGFTLNDYMDRLEEALEALTGAVVAGKLILEGAEVVVDVRDHFEDIPRVWNGLFTGANTGKLVTKVAE